MKVPNFNQFWSYFMTQTQLKSILFSLSLLISSKSAFAVVELSKITGHWLCEEHMSVGSVAHSFLIFKGVRAGDLEIRGDQLRVRGSTIIRAAESKEDPSSFDSIVLDEKTNSLSYNKVKKGTVIQAFSWK